MKSIKENFLYNTILTISQVLFPLLTFPYVAKILMPEGIGLIAFIDSFTRYFILFSSLGLPIYGIREIAKVKNNKEELNRLFSELIYIHLFTTIIILIIFFLIVINSNKLFEFKIYYFIGSILILSNVFAIEWYYQGIEDFKFITIRSLVVKFILTIAVFLLIKKSSDTLLYYIIWIFSTVISSIINFIYSWSTVKLQFKIEINSLKRHIKPLLFIFSSLAFISIYTLLDTILLGLLSNNHAVGIYSTALKLVKLPVLFIGSLGVVLIPKLSEKYHEGNFEDFKKLITESVNFVFTFSIPLIFIIVGISKEIILLFAGPSYLNSSLVLDILSVLILLIGLSNVFGMQILTPMSKDKYLTYSVAIGTFISLVLNLILIPIIQELGSSISNICAEIAVTISTIYFAKKYIAISFDYYFILKTILTSIPLLIFPKILSLYFVNNFSLVITTCIISLIYFMLIQIFYIKNPNAVNLFKKFKKYV